MMPIVHQSPRKACFCEIALVQERNGNRDSSGCPKVKKDDHGRVHRFVNGSMNDIRSFSMRIVPREVFRASSRSITVAFISFMVQALPLRTLRTHDNA